MRQTPDIQAPSAHRPSAARAARSGRWFLLAGALALSACISDGPNQTGGEYLAEHGILLRQPLHKVVLENFPLDSSWTVDGSRNWLGDSLLMLGEWNGFTAETRLAFDISDTTYLDSLGEENNLRLGLSFLPASRSSDQLIGTVAGADSMRLVIESWVVPDAAANPDRREDSLLAWTIPFIQRQDSAVRFDPALRVADTAVIRVDTLYKSTTLLSPRLPNLSAALRQKTNRRHLVLIQLRHLPDSAFTPVMLRFTGNRLSLGDLTAYAPALLFSKDELSVLKVNSRQRLHPLETSDNRLEVNSSVRFHGSDSSILVGRTRGLHLRINQKRLFDSLSAKLGDSLRTAATGAFDLSYFVPFASITLPLDTPSRVEGNFPVGFRLRSDLDSLLPNTEVGTRGRKVVALGDTTTLFWFSDRRSRDDLTDSVRAIYQADSRDTGLRQLVLLTSRDTAFRDTTNLVAGRSIEISRAGTGSPAILSITPGRSEAVVHVHLNTRGDEENQVFRDPITGDPLDEVSQRLPRFLKPGDQSLTLRATRGFQRLLNRRDIDNELQSDLFVLPFDVGAADTATGQLVPYPVLGEVRPRIREGALRVNITLYLYPLKDR
ncbi:MAG TPA: hypothetical protein VK465_04760 [Fibrobacteria bacterium]|nr:hypothetical protein [Fibrobacteria bacterium]